MRIYPHKVGAIMCGLSLWLSCGSAWALFQHTLKGIEIDSSPVETRIILKADNRIPYRVVSQTSEKIVVDLDAVDPTQSIQTDFASAENIEQVILKPLGANKIRMVVRGERLGNTVVSSKEEAAVKEKAQAKRKSQSVVYENETVDKTQKPSKVLAPDDNGISMAAMEMPAATAENPSDTQTTPNSEESGNAGFLATEETDNSANALLNNEDYDLASETPPQEAVSDRQALIDDKTVADTTDVESEDATWQDLFIAGFQSTMGLGSNILSKTDPGLLFRIIAFSGVLILLGLFIRRKLTQDQNQAYYDEYEDYESNSGFGGFFSKKKGPSNANTGRSLFGNQNLQAPSRQPASRRPAQDRPVGLGGLNGQPAYDTNLIADSGSQQLIHQNHALNQYNKNAAPPLNRPNYRDSRDIDRELQRSIHMREATTKTHTRKQPAKPAAASNKVPPARPQQQRGIQPQTNPLNQPKAPTKQAQPTPGMNNAFNKRQESGLPSNNNEVLDFLRNVAELMEKDGRPELARGVKKGLNPKNKF